MKCICPFSTSSKWQNVPGDQALELEVVRQLLEYLQQQIIGDIRADLEKEQPSIAIGSIQCVWTDTDCTCVTDQNGLVRVIKAKCEGTLTVQVKGVGTFSKPLTFAEFGTTNKPYILWSRYTDTKQIMRSIAEVL